ncbi:yippee zinc-binding/DNA-binding /Mis18, centromere assembly-domain-containing protein [Lasiosphaeria hispida]|uniref:Yippee zinc-binding/DNA-binding /Mis18, centromere assembly-domain-containing protein n=1 Tax=Lasiosphaeria hispida TaxID=260671 RepID=A0AAJ0HP38_9PEZI|nr:yippee zinc-binding/DNA-binding /Mis18, centromere assembly-domain-containing protein [Lasiosphaeria hispida]
MFGDISIFTRPVVPPTPDDGPTFPLYLLPSFSLPFRRRRSSVSRPAQIRHAAAPEDSDPGDESSVPSLSSSPDSPDKEAAPALAPTGPRLARTQPDTLRCNTCAADIAFASQIVSKGFTGRHGRAYLVSPPSAQATPSCPGSPLNNDTVGAESELVNIRVGRAENRHLATGVHVVADIWCVVCSTKIGWKYVDARSAAQKYKVGKFILETQRVVMQHSWEYVSGNACGGRQSARASTDTDASASRVSDESDITDDDGGVIVFDSEDEDECDDIFAGVWDPDVVAKRRKGKVINMRRAGGAA